MKIIRLVKEENKGYGGGLYAWIYDDEKLVRVPCYCTCGVAHINDKEDFEKELELSPPSKKE